MSSSSRTSAKEVFVHQTARRTPLVRYFLLTYLTFWILLGVTGVLRALKVPSLLVTVMQNVCAWSPTFVVAFQFRKLYPNTTLVEYLRRNFLSRTNPLVFVLILVIQSAILCLAVTAQLVFSGVSVGTMSFITLPSLLPTLLITITSGPLGEELGWRGYALIELQKRFSPFASAVTLGVIWGFWHTPLWLISGYAGTKLFAYIIFFLIGIVCVSMSIAVFYNRNRNILVPMSIHFLFNFLLRLTNLDMLPLLGYTSAGYMILAAILVVHDRKALFQKPSRNDGTEAAMA